jgi:hypothetical protein
MAKLEKASPIRNYESAPVKLHRVIKSATWLNLKSGLLQRLAAPWTNLFCPD